MKLTETRQPGKQVNKRVLHGKWEKVGRMEGREVGWVEGELVLFKRVVLWCVRAVCVL